VLPRYRAVVFVHGCFWHRHPNCKDATLPKANTEFWTRKLNANVERDRSAASALRSRGWHIIYVWECEIGDVESLASRLFAELDSALGVAR
jgi:DNA mismatch endonuclease (patch repair protein)